MIRLKRFLGVSSFDVQATVALGRHRPEFLAVAQLAAGLDRSIRAADVLQELIGPRAEILGQRIIERCIALRLLEQQGSETVLSEAGRIALTHKEVLVPHEGLWRFFFVDDPLLPGSVIHVQRLEPSPVSKDLAAAKEDRQRRKALPQGAICPGKLHRCLGEIPRPSVQDGHLFQLHELSGRGENGPAGRLELSFTWGEGPSLRLSGNLPLGEKGRGRPIDTELEIPERITRHSRQQIWRELVARATHVPVAELERWQQVAGKPVVPTSFASIDSMARHLFRRDLDIPATNLLELGSFEPTKLEGVDLVPSSNETAQEWLGWLQWESLDEYVTPDLLNRKSAELLARFTHHLPRALSASELLTRALTHRDDHSWFLLAPYDLGLWS